MKNERSVTITESEYDKIIEELIRHHEARKCKDVLIKYFILDAILIRNKLFYDD